MSNPDQAFVDRADAHVRLANEQAQGANRGNAAASLAFGSARYNMWIMASGHQSGADLQKAGPAVIAGLMDQYRRMLEDNLADYIENFAEYFASKG
jgi:hypothetical protein